MCTSNRDDRKLENTVKQSWFKHLGELHKEWTEAGVSASRAQTSSGKELPRHFWTRNIVRSILPGLKRKITGLLLSGPKPSFQMKVNLACHLEIKVPESGERVEDTESMLLEVQCEVSTVSDDLGCHVICWCWSTVFSEVHSQRSHLPGHFTALHAFFCWQALWRCWFHFPAWLGTCSHWQRYQKLVQWPWCYCAWLWENPWGIFKRKMMNSRSRRAEDSIVPQADRFHSSLMLEFVLKKPRPSTECLN